MYCQNSPEWRLARAINYNLVCEASDKNGKPVLMDRTTSRFTYVYGHADKRDAETAKALTLYEARRIAINIAG
jgi:hypothetical protein